MTLEKEMWSSSRDGASDILLCKPITDKEMGEALWDCPKWKLDEVIEDKGNQCTNYVNRCHMR